MQAIAGLQVSLRHDNNHTIPATLLSGPNGPLADTSRLSFATIRATPGKNLRITISENHEYNGHGAQGLKIGVAHGFLDRDDKAHTIFQEWFLPNERLREGTLIAEAYVLWNHEAADSDEHRFIVPRAECKSSLPKGIGRILTHLIALAPEEKPRNYVWMEEGLDHGVEPGCIAVCLTRGDLSYAMNSPLPLDRFDPPNDFRYVISQPSLKYDSNVWRQGSEGLFADPV